MTPRRTSPTAHSDLTWSLPDLRRWLASSARYRWLRALRLVLSRDLTNFGDLR
jgi:hypothetical protein